VDPNNPTGTPDLLHNGRDPWRPSRRQAAITSLGVVVIALITSGTVWVRHVRHEHALDQAAIRAVRVVVGGTDPSGLTPGEPAEGPALNLLNTGRSLVTVLSVRLDGGPLTPVEIGGSLAPQTSTSLLVAKPGACTPRTGRVHPRKVTLEMVTARGTRFNRTQVVADDQVINGSERFRCGTLTPTEALASSIVSAISRGGWVDVIIDLRDTSVLPVTVRTLAAPAGLQMVLPHLPLLLPPAAAPQSTGPSRQVHLRLRVTDCDAFNSALQRTFPGFMELRLHGAYEDEVAKVSLEPSQETGFGVDAPDAQLELMKFCPDLFFD
jgi:hypothetical protein